jgi:hypothetical protein
MRSNIILLRTEMKNIVRNSPIKSGITERIISSVIFNFVKRLQESVNKHFRLPNSKNYENQDIIYITSYRDIEMSELHTERKRRY